VSVTGDYIGNLETWKTCWLFTNLVSSFIRYLKFKGREESSRLRGFQTGCSNAKFESWENWKTLYLATCKPLSHFSYSWRLTSKTIKMVLKKRWYIVIRARFCICKETSRKEDTCSCTFHRRQQGNPTVHTCSAHVHKHKRPTVYFRHRAGPGWNEIVIRVKFHFSIIVYEA